MPKICTVADVPPELVEAWVQHLRDFDAAHPGCHFRVVAKLPDEVSTREMMDMLDRIDPTLPYRRIVRRQQ
ncbi:MAG TPA: hypothetical protein VF748_07450 [Candidatus Acidoferrum sp.]